MTPRNKAVTHLKETSPLPRFRLRHVEDAETKPMILSDILRSESSVQSRLTALI
jgi:hypothetical protein